MRRSASTGSRQRGALLLEALIAFLVLGLGILTLCRVQTHFRVGADIARQRSEAVRLGQQELESLRAFSVVPAAAGTRSYAAIEAAVRNVDSDSSAPTTTSYRVTRKVQATASAAAKSITVTVGWSDRAGSDQHVVLSSIIGAHDPYDSAALQLASAAPSSRGAFGRSTQIPLAAQNIGSGSSMFEPPGAAGLAYVFDNATGRIVARCPDGVAARAAATVADTATTAGTVAGASNADATGCTPSRGYRLSGTIRFSLAEPPDAAHARDTALALTVTLASRGDGYPAAPSCSSAALKTVTYTSGGVSRVEAVPVDAVPASVGVTDWSDSGDRYIDYDCIVEPAANGRWSGRMTLVPVGWTIGTSPIDRRVCRFLADTDSSGAVDTNGDHPAEYVDVDGSLANRNFLVIGGAEQCPGATLATRDNGAAAIAINRSTAQHQP